MGLEFIDYDASVADFFIFYQIFSRATRSRNVRVPNGMCARDHRRRVVDVTRDGVVDADAPSRALTRPRARRNLARVATDARTMADCTVAVAERVDEGARDAKTGADSTTRATHDVDGARDAIDDDGDEGAREGAMATRDATDDATLDDDAARDAKGSDSRERTVFIGGTSHECDEARVRRFFEEEHDAKVENVKLIYDRQTLVRKGYGFVKFYSVEDAARVKAMGKVTIDGKAVDAKEATRDEPASAGEGRTREGRHERTRSHGSGKMSRGSSHNSLSEHMGRMSVGNGARVSGGAPQRHPAGGAPHLRGAKASKAQLSRSPNYVGGLDDGASGSESGERSNSGAPGTENTVFCGGLPLEATPEALGWFFAHYGTVLSVKLIYDKLTGACKGYGFVVFADVAIAEMVKAQRQIPFLGKMIDVSEAMRHVGRHDDGRGFAPGAQYGTKRAMGYGSQGPFYPPQMSMYPPHMVMPPHMAMGGQNPHMAMMAMHHMQFAGYPMYANGATVYGMPGEHVEDVEEDSDEVAAEGETVAASE